MDDYRNGLRVIEEEFGLDWLKKNATDLEIPERLGCHPVPQDWKIVRKLLDEFDRMGTILTSRALVNLTELGYILASVRTLQGYDVAIRPRLKKATDFAKLEYELYIASLYARSDYVTEFVPPSTVPGVRTPDLRICFEASEIPVECVRKEGHKVTGLLQSATWDKVRQGISTILEQLSASHQVSVIAFGECSEASIPHLLNIVKERISGNIEGIWIDKKNGFAVDIQSLKLRYRPLEEGLRLIPSEGDPVTVFATIDRDANGKFFLKNTNEVSLHLIDSHKLSSVLHTFNEKRRRGQFPENTSGILHIDLDVTHIRQSDGIDKYIGLLGKIFGASFTANANTRIGALVLTSSPIFQERKEEGRTIINKRRAINVVRNPFGKLPARITLPFEAIHGIENCGMAEY